jgi:hypothetical protein
VDPHHIDADQDSTYAPNADPDSDFYIIRIRLYADVEPDPDPSFLIKAQTLEKVLKLAHITYILGSHLQTDSDPDPDYHFDEDADFYLMRILITKMMRIRIHNTAPRNTEKQNILYPYLWCRA